MTSSSSSSTTQQTENSDEVSQLQDVLDAVKDERLDSRSILKKVSDILSQKKSGNQKTRALKFLQQVDPELYEYLPEDLKQDRDIILLVLQKDGKLLRKIPKSYQYETLLIEKSLDTMIRKSASIFDIIDVLDFYRSDAELFSSLEKYVQEKISRKELGFKNNLEKYLYLLFTQEYENYNFLMESNIFLKEAGRVRLHPHVLRACFSQNTEEIPKDSISQSRYFFEKLLTYAKLGLGETSKLLDQVLYGLLDQVHFEAQKSKESLKKSEKENRDGEKSLKQKKSSAVSETTIESPKSEYHFLENYRSFSYAGSYTIWDSVGNVSYIEKTELSQMNERSFENYLAFHSLLKDLQLDFLLRKHASRIMLATRVNFYSDTGMDDVRTLKFLNSIGKNIGIPQSSFVVSDDENTEEKVGCFHSLDAAKKAFRDIKESGTIAGKHICDPADRGDQSIVEICMKHNGCITLPYLEISLAHWKY